MRDLARFILAILSLMLIPVWIWHVVPRFITSQETVALNARLESYDDLYRPDTGSFSGPTRSVAKIETRDAGMTGGVQFLDHSFTVFNVVGDTIYQVERRYAINPLTRAHAPFVGVQNREGYFFAPRRLRRGEPFTTWWVNYDGSAHMQFVQEEEISGLRVFRYETRYEGVRIDQTNELGDLPGVPEERGVELEPHLTMWIEPTTGELVNVKDETTAYFYAMRGGARLEPWNRFSNTFAQDDLAQRVEQVRAVKRMNDIYIFGGSVVLALLACALFFPKLTAYAQPLLHTMQKGL